MAIQHANRENAVLDFWISLSPHVRVSMTTLAIAGIAAFCGISNLLIN